MTLDWTIMCELFQVDTHRPPPLQWGVFRDLLERLSVGKTIFHLLGGLFNFTPSRLWSCQKKELKIIACNCFLTISDDNQWENWFLVFVRPRSVFPIISDFPSGTGCFLGGGVQVKRGEIRKCLYLLGSIYASRDHNRWWATSTLLHYISFEIWVVQWNILMINTNTQRTIQRSSSWAIN